METVVRRGAAGVVVRVNWGSAVVRMQRRRSEVLRTGRRGGRSGKCHVGNRCHRGCMEDWRNEGERKSTIKHIKLECEDTSRGEGEKVEINDWEEEVQGQVR